MRWAVVLVAALATGAVGCGYVDDNPRAARLVAQAYLDAFANRAAPDICRVSAPEVQAVLAAGKPSCEAGLAPQLVRRYPRLTTGRIRKVVPAPATNPRYAVEVRGAPGRWIVVGRYGSIWRVIDGEAMDPT